MRRKKALSKYISLWLLQPRGAFHVGEQDVKLWGCALLPVCHFGNVVVLRVFFLDGAAVPDAHLFPGFTDVAWAQRRHIKPTVATIQGMSDKGVSCEDFHACLLKGVLGAVGATGLGPSRKIFCMYSSSLSEGGGEPPGLKSMSHPCDS